MFAHPVLIGKAIKVELGFTKGDTDIVGLLRGRFLHDGRSSLLFCKTHQGES
jgi:hypothetical protein